MYISLSLLITVRLLLKVGLFKIREISLCLEYFAIPLRVILYTCMPIVYFIRMHVFFKDIIIQVSVMEGKTRVI